MASSVPASLKSADVTRFAHRAAQLEKPRPAVAYWCNYWILNQILSKGLHNVDQEALVYTTELMDKVEQFKSANLTNDAVADDVAGKAYIEQFGLETFGKADNAVRANKVTTATADTFQAAATFLELLAVWGPLEPEITTKVKYAKFHAVRILKAVRAGEDPNLSNPKPEPEPEQILPPLDPNDAEVKALEGYATNTHRASVVEVPDESDKLQAKLAKTSDLNESLHPSRDQSQARPPQPSAVEVPDEAHRIQNNLAKASTKDESLHPSRVPSRPTSVEGNVSPLEPQDAAAFYTSNQADVSPLDPPSERKPSIGGNYFPLVSNGASGPPAPPSHPLESPLDLPGVPSEPTLPHAPNTFTSDIAPSVQAPAISPNPGPNPHSQFMPPPAPPPGHAPPGHAPPGHAPPGHAPPGHAPPGHAPPGHAPQIPPNLAPQAAPQPQPPVVPPQYRQAPQNYHQPQAPPQSRPPPAVYAPPVNHPHQPAPVAHPVVQPPVQRDVVVDEEAMMRAQKHARWAISALNFEDVPTAIKELQGALSVLGAR